MNPHLIAGNLAYLPSMDARAPAQNDVIQMCRTPPGATILDVVVYGQDIDTGTEAVDFDAGYAANSVDTADPDAWGNFGVVTGGVPSAVRRSVFAASDEERCRHRQRVCFLNLMP